VVDGGGNPQRLVFTIGEERRGIERDVLPAFCETRGRGGQPNACFQMLDQGAIRGLGAPRVWEGNAGPSQPPPPHRAHGVSGPPTPAPSPRRGPDGRLAASPRDQDPRKLGSCRQTRKTGCWDQKTPPELRNGGGLWGVSTFPFPCHRSVGGGLGGGPPTSGPAVTPPGPSRRELAGHIPKRHKSDDAFWQAPTWEVSGSVRTRRVGSQTGTSRNQQNELPSTWIEAFKHPTRLTSCGGIHRDPLAAKSQIRRRVPKDSSTKGVRRGGHWVGSHRTSKQVEGTRGTQVESRGGETRWCAPNTPKQTCLRGETGGARTQSAVQPTSVYRGNFHRPNPVVRGHSGDIYGSPRQRSGTSRHSFEADRRVAWGGWRENSSQTYRRFSYSAGRAGVDRRSGLDRELGGAT